jgi:hypothetical protein
MYILIAEKLQPHSLMYLIPDLKETVPATRTYSHAIFSDTQVADTVVMAS